MATKAEALTAATRHLRAVFPAPEYRVEPDGDMVRVFARWSPEKTGPRFAFLYGAPDWHFVTFLNGEVWKCPYSGPCRKSCRWSRATWPS